MGRVSTKENKTIYQLTREKLGLTRENAEELLDGMTVDTIERIENEKRIPKPDEVIQMADKYKEPAICNYYCSHQCEVGKRYVPEIKTSELPEIILRMLASLNSAQELQRRLIEITADGKIEKSELSDFIEIQRNLEDISQTVEALQLWVERKIKNGDIDIDEYNKLTSSAE